MRLLGRLHAVIGLGRFGSAVARELAAEGLNVLALDSDPERVQELAHDVARVVRCDATDIEALRALDLAEAEVAVVSIGSHLEASILATLYLKKLGVKQIIARAVSDEHGEALKACGADRVVYPQREVGMRVAHTLVSARVKEYVELLEGVGLLEIEAPAAFVGKTLEQLELSRRYGVTVIGIRRGERVVATPGAGVQVREGDILVLIGQQDGLQLMEEAP